MSPGSKRASAGLSLSPSLPPAASSRGLRIGGEETGDFPGVLDLAIAPGHSFGNTHFLARDEGDLADSPVYIRHLDGDDRARIAGSLNEFLSSRLLTRRELLALAG